MSSTAQESQSLSPEKTNPPSGIAPSSPAATQKRKLIFSAFLATLFWVIIAFILTAIFSLIIDYLNFTYWSLREGRENLFGSLAGGFVTFLPTALIFTLPALVVGVLASLSKKFSTFLVFAIPVLSLILIPVLLVSAPSCGGGATSLGCPFWDEFATIMYVLAFLASLGVIYLAVSVLPIAWILRKEDFVNARELILKSLKPGIVVVILFIIWGVVVNQPYLNGLFYQINVQKNAKAEIKETKGRFAFLEPTYLPTNVSNNVKETPAWAGNGVYFDYECTYSGTFEIRQFPLSNPVPSPSAGVNPSRLSHVEETLKKSTPDILEELTINGKKGYYTASYYRKTIYDEPNTNRLNSSRLVWETDEFFVEIKTYGGGCVQEKDELIKVAESMKPYDPSTSERTNKRLSSKDRLEKIKSTFTVLEPTYIPATLEKKKEYEFVGGVENTYDCNDKDESTGLSIRQWPLKVAPESEKLTEIEKDLGSNPPDADGVRYKDIYPPGKDKLDIKYILEEMYINNNKAFYVELRTAEGDPKKPTTRRLNWVQGGTLIKIVNGLACLLPKDDFIKIAESMN